MASPAPPFDPSLLPKWSSAVLSGTMSAAVLDPEGLTVLHRAVWLGDLSLTAQLLDSGKCPVDICDSDQQTPLMFAAINGNLQVMKKLLDCGASVDFRRKDGATAACIGAQSGELEAVVVLRSRGANLTVVDESGSGVAHWAASNDDVQMLRLFRALDLPLSEINLDGYTPLHLAAQSNSYRAAQFLLAAGCDRNVAGKDGLTAEYLARKCRSEDVLHAFRELEKSIFEQYFPVVYFTYLILLYGTWTYYQLDSLFPSLLFLILLLVQLATYLILLCSSADCLPHQSDIHSTSNIHQIVEKFESEQFDSIPRGSQFCMTCHVLRPQRSKHCRKCGKCVLLQDLHCDLLGKCVGKGNRRTFFVWAGTGYLLVFLHVFFQWSEHHAAISDAPFPGYIYLLFLQYSTSPFLSQLMIIPNLCVLWYSFVHLCLLLYSISSALTINEVLNPHRYRYLFSKETGNDEYEVFKNPFYRSALSSWGHFILGSSSRSE